MNHFLVIFCVILHALFGFHFFVYLCAFYDADWVGYASDMTSTGAYIIYFGPKVISWNYKKHSSIAKSSIEAVYHTIATTVTELLWLQQLLKEPHV